MSKPATKSLGGIIFRMIDIISLAIRYFKEGPDNDEAKDVINHDSISNNQALKELK
jgi:hypothetical protein